MAIHIEQVCRHCGVVIEPLDPDATIVLDWIHVGLSIYCPGSAGLFKAAPTITILPRSD